MGDLIETPHRRGTSLTSDLPKNSPATQAASLATSIEARTITVAPGLVRFSAGHGLTQKERGEINRSLASVRRGLDNIAHDGDERIAGVILGLHVAMGRELPPSERRAVIRAYFQALADKPAPAIEEAIRRFNADETEFSPSFMPRPPELSRITKAVVAEWTLTVSRLERLLRLEEQPTRPDHPISPADAQKLAALRAKLPNTFKSAGAPR